MYLLLNVLLNLFSSAEKYANQKTQGKKHKKTDPDGRRALSGAHFAGGNSGRIGAA